jgi:soluble lytic murein transglycosylase
MKYSGKVRAITFGLGGLVLFLMFQNMSFVEFGSLQISNVDEGSRQEQARELLGASYRRSFARRLEGEQNLNYLIFQEIEKGMGSQWKDKVPELTQAIISESRELEFDPVFILAVIQTESQFNPNARGSAGEIGLMQILPPTAEWIAKKYKVPWNGDQTLFNPVTNIRIGIRYFDYLRSEFERMAYHYLPAYNMGPKNMRRVTRQIGDSDSDGRILKRDYAMRVMKNYSEIYEEMVAASKDSNYDFEQFAKGADPAAELPHGTQ